MILLDFVYFNNSINNNFISCGKQAKLLKHKALGIYISSINTIFVTFSSNFGILFSYLIFKYDLSGSNIITHTKYNLLFSSEKLRRLSKLK